jgi:hypothetical protein
VGGLGALADDDQAGALIGADVAEVEVTRNPRRCSMIRTAVWLLVSSAIESASCSGAYHPLALC